MTVGQLKARMDEEEFRLWQVFYGISPFGDERRDVNAATIASTVANVNSRRTYLIKDFLPYDKPRMDLEAARKFAARF